MQQQRKTKRTSKAIVHDMRHFDPDGPYDHEDALRRLRRGEIVKACHLPEGRARGRLSVETKIVNTLTGRKLLKRRTVWLEEE
jgi:hypothetical protein